MGSYCYDLTVDDRCFYELIDSCYCLLLLLSYFSFYSFLNTMLYLFLHSTSIELNLMPHLLTLFSSTYLSTTTSPLSPLPSPLHSSPSPSLSISSTSPCFYMQMQFHHLLHLCQLHLQFLLVLLSSIISAVGVTAHGLLLGSFVVWLCSVVIVGFWSVIVIV
jgi:hypothetical protein